MCSISDEILGLGSFRIVQLKSNKRGRLVLDFVSLRVVMKVYGEIFLMSCQTTVSHVVGRSLSLYFMSCHSASLNWKFSNSTQRNKSNAARDFFDIAKACNKALQEIKKLRLSITIISNHAGRVWSDQFHPSHKSIESMSSKSEINKSSLINQSLSSPHFGISPHLSLML